MIKIFSCDNFELIDKLLILAYNLPLFHEFSEVCLSKIAKISLFQLLELLFKLNNPL